MPEFEDALNEVSVESRLDELERQKFALQQQLEKEKKSSSVFKKQLQEKQTEVQRALTELSLYQADHSDRPEWMKRPKKERGRQHHGTIVSHLSDTHYGERVVASEIGGYNSYDMEVAEIRTRRFFERTIKVARNYLAGVKYDGAVLPLGGDLVSGDIHEELKETNELSVFRVVETVIPWLAAGVQMFQEEFGRVHVVSAPGNHGRNSKTPRHKKRSENNADTHLAHMLAREFREVEDVTFDIPDSPDVDFDLYGYRFSVEHGDNLKFNGTSEIGSLGPVKRGTLRKTKKRQEMGSPFKYLLLGHFHQYIPAYTQGFVVNGSLKGYDEYASNGQFAPEPAQQSLMVVTPEHGVTIAAPIFVQKGRK